MAINKKTMRVNEDVEKLEPSSTAGRNIKYRNKKKNIETIWHFLKRLNTKLSYDPAITLLGIHSRELKPYVHTKLIQSYTHTYI